MNGWHGGRTDKQTDGRKTVIGEAEDKYKIRSDFSGSDLNTSLPLAIFLQPLVQK